MNKIYMDVETFSDVDLAKCGVYRYAQSPNFEILLFSYSVDDEEVKIVDIAKGEKIPEEIIKALTDNKVEKHAYNAVFERVCLSKYLGYPVGLYLSPDGWYCDMIHAAYLGLPFSLESVGTILGLEKQKLSSGKDLIKYFCIPQTPKKSNNYRVRNYFYDNPEKWEQFKTYNKRDVETEMEISKRISKFPVPNKEWDNYHLDQRINDYGIMLDMDFVEHAIKCDEINAEESYDRVKKITGINNPNSPKQLKEWLVEQGIKGVDSLAKADVARLLKDATGNVEEILKLRQALAKSSVKKYTAMQNAVCKDNRARGLFQFYGANRTGRFCLTGDHEVLTTDGWKRLDEWSGGKIACWNPQGEIISFQKANALEFDYKGEVYDYEDKRISQISTPEHKMYVKKRYGGKWQIDTIENMKNYRPSIPFVGYQKCGVGMEQEKLRVLIMTQADGCYTEQGDIMFSFHKTRKYERCKRLLRNANIQFIAKEYDDVNVTRLCIKIFSRQIPLWLRIFNNKTYGTWLFSESSDVFFDELQYWDGYKSATNSIQYCTCNKENADIVQAFAHITGRAACIRERVRAEKHPNWNDAYVVDIWLTPINCHEIRVKPQISNYEGKVYCAETNTGFFLVRRNGRCWITGNSGRLIQLQNLPQNHLEALEEARELIRSEDLKQTSAKFGGVSNVLSELIRTAFIPKDGCRFIVSDFSSIEARVIAWYAKEEWRLKLFEEGGDIYCQSASKMFGVPVVKNGINGELRQKGKIAELACIAEDELVLTNEGLIPIQNVTKKQLVWDGLNWVKHEGVIFKGYKEIINYEGLRATKDHKVYIKGKREPIQFIQAATSNLHLVQSGDSGKAIWLGRYNSSYEEMEQKQKSLLCADDVQWMWKNSVANIGFFNKWKKQRLSTMFATKTDSTLVRQKINCSEAKMRKSKGSKLSKLWSKRNKVLFLISKRGWNIFNKRVWDTIKRIRDRQNKQQLKLYDWQFAFCDAYQEQPKQAWDCINWIRTKILALYLSSGDTNVVMWNESRRNNSTCNQINREKMQMLENNPNKVRVYDIRNAGPLHRFTVSNHLVHNCGYGGSIGALKAFGAVALGIKESELQGIINAWREASPKIVKFWWDIDRVVKSVIQTRIPRKCYGLELSYERDILFIRLPSGRRLAYCKPRMGINAFGSECVTYEGVGTNKKWERLESYGPKFVENIVQATARDILCEAMMRLYESGYKITMHIHDEVVLEVPNDYSNVEEVNRIMGISPEWAKDLHLKADGYECKFYKKE